MASTAVLCAAEAQAFLFREARLLDDGNLRAWQDLLTSDMIYWVPVNNAGSDPQQHLAIIYDDRAALDNRIWRLIDSGINHTQEPRSLTMRLLSNVETEAADEPNEVIVRCNLLLHEFRAGAQRRLPVNAHPARCEYRLRFADGCWKIAYKKVALLLMDAALPPMSFMI